MFSINPEKEKMEISRNRKSAEPSGNISYLNLTLPPGLHN